MAIETVKDFRPDQWWSQFGYSAPAVSKLAIKIPIPKQSNYEKRALKKKKLVAKKAKHKLGGNFLQHDIPAKLSECTLQNYSHSQFFNLHSQKTLIPLPLLQNPILNGIDLHPRRFQRAQLLQMQKTTSF
ncbi:hypothetical protein RIF29_18651 [Crotalaria pallida]|uniref:Uncharacterized protein n=1 Tax=Crotalaria pallida TaxID=3830 RepID=A0AAN9EY07_CROPI